MNSRGRRSLQAKREFSEFARRSTQIRRRTGPTSESHASVSHSAKKIRLAGAPISAVRVLHQCYASDRSDQDRNDATWWAASRGRRAPGERRESESRNKCRQRISVRVVFAQRNQLTSRRRAIVGKPRISRCEIWNNEGGNPLGVRLRGQGWGSPTWESSSGKSFRRTDRRTTGRPTDRTDL